MKRLELFDPPCADQGEAVKRSLPQEQAKRGRCNARFLQGTSQTCYLCSRWKGHEGLHSGTREGRFYGGERVQWGGMA